MLPRLSAHLTDLIQPLFITMATNTELKTYTGNCHCGLYKYTLTRPAITSATSCNCSICSRNAYLYVDIPEGSTFKVERGEGELKRYAFGSKKWYVYLSPPPTLPYHTGLTASNPAWQ